MPLQTRPRWSASTTFRSSAPQEVNEIDRRADSPIAVSLDSLSRDLAGSRTLTAAIEPKAEAESWFQRLLMVFGGAFAGVAALVRMLLG